MKTDKVIFIGIILDEYGRLLRVTDAYKVEAELLDHEHLNDYHTSGVVMLNLNE